MKSTCTVVCAEFVPGVFVLHFMPKDLHFVCVHIVYRVRQRILTFYHYRTLPFFSARPPVHFGDYELMGTKKIKCFANAEIFLSCAYSARDIKLGENALKNVRSWGCPLVLSLIALFLGEESAQS